MSMPSTLRTLSRSREREDRDREDYREDRKYTESRRNSHASFDPDNSIDGEGLLLSLSTILLVVIFISIAIWASLW